MYYKCGIYEHTHGEQLAGYVVKIIGWGSEEGKKFWGADWAEKRFSRIKFGECLFDKNALTGIPKNDVLGVNFRIIINLRINKIDKNVYLKYL